MRDRRPLILASVLAIPVFACVAAACGGGRGSAGVASVASSTTTAQGSPSTSSSTSSAQGNRALAYSRCMRSHGVPDYPDPDRTGGTDKSKVIAARSETGSSRFDAALNACQRLLPSSPPGPTPAEVQQAMTAMANFARCVRSHGVPNWPDPYLDVGRPTFDIHSIDFKAPRISTALHECQHLMPGSTLPLLRVCSALLAEQNGGAPGDEACFGGLLRAP